MKTIQTTQVKICKKTALLSDLASTGLKLRKIVTVKKKVIQHTSNIRKFTTRGNK